MTRHIERQILQLKELILHFGTMVEESISHSNIALFKQDLSLATKVIANDAEIDRMEVELEEECLKVLALYQPVAADLRFVVAVLKINNDLERIGDLTSNKSLDAVVTGDPDLARQVREEDDAVDAGRQAVSKLVMQKIQEDPQNVESLLRINSVSKHLERVADMATNIAEDVIYMVEGEIVRHRHGD